jgi:transcriptional regulator with XRE-family HTH domain
MAKKQKRKQTKKPEILTEQDKNLGARIRIYRRKADLNQTTLAKAVGVSYQQLQKYETGKNAVPPARLPALAEALGVTLADLTSGTLSATGSATPLLSAMAIEVAVAFDVLQPPVRAAVRDLIGVLSK